MMIFTLTFLFLFLVGLGSESSWDSVVIQNIPHYITRNPHSTSRFIQTFGLQPHVDFSYIRIPQTGVALVSGDFHKLKALDGFDNWRSLTKHGYRKVGRFKNKITIVKQIKIAEALESESRKLDLLMEKLHKSLYENRTDTRMQTFRSFEMEHKFIMARSLMNKSSREKIEKETISPEVETFLSILNHAK